MVNFRKQNRLIKYDYSQPGYYFITICASNRIEYFGVIKNGKMVLSELGKIANDVWLRTAVLYKNIKINEFIVMPNHMHGIVIIKDVVQAPGLLRPSLSQIIGSYKNVVTKLARQKEKEFFWQPSFYDHVIRKDEGLDKIREYIVNNPLKWELDRNNPFNLWM